MCSIIYNRPSVDLAFNCKLESFVLHKVVDITDAFLTVFRTDWDLELKTH